MLRRALFALALVSISSATPAHAAPRTLKDAVRVEGGVCLSAPTLVQAIAVWRGSDAVAEGLAVDVTGGPGKQAKFVVRKGDSVLGEREIDGANASCHELANAIALLVAVALDAAEAGDRSVAVPAAAAASATGVPSPAIPPDATTAAVSPAPTTAAVSPGAPGSNGSPAAPGSALSPAIPSAAPAPAIAPAFVARPLTIPRDFGSPPPSPRARLALEIIAGGGGVFDVAAARAALVTTSIGLRIGPPQGLGGALRAGVLATSDEVLAFRQGEVHARLTAGRLDLCGSWLPGRAGLEACAGFGAGWLSLSGTGYDSNASADAPWAALVGRLAGRLSLVGPLGLMAGADLLVPVLAPRLQLQSPAGTIVAEEQVPPVGVGIFLAVTFTFL